MRLALAMLALCACDRYADEYAEEHRPVVSISDATAEEGTARALCAKGMPVAGGCMCSGDADAALMQSFPDYDNPSWVCVCTNFERVSATALCVEGF